MANYPFEPDWCLAPAVPLEEWLDDNGDRSLAHVAFPPMQVRQPGADQLVQEVLDRKPLTPAHAQVLQRGTGIPARMWLDLEHNYRAGLAAGLTDVSDG